MYRLAYDCYGILPFFVGGFFCCIFLSPSFLFFVLAIYVKCIGRSFVMPKSNQHEIRASMIFYPHNKSQNSFQFSLHIFIVSFFLCVFFVDMLLFDRYAVYTLFHLFLWMFSSLAISPAVSLCLLLRIRPIKFRPATNDRILCEYTRYTRCATPQHPNPQGKDLPAKDLSGTSDPYVRVTLLPDKKHRLETKIKRRTLNPRWNETFYFEGFPIQKLNTRVLHLHVFDYDRFSRDDSIGEVFLPLCQVSGGATL